MELTLTAVALVLTAFAVALASLFAISMFDQRRGDALRKLARSEKKDVVFLFDGTTAVDASAGARQVLATSPETGSDWDRLRALLIRRFPDITKVECELVDKGEITLVSPDGAARLLARWQNGLARIQLVDDADPSTDTGLIDRHALAAMEAELATLRGLAEHVPYLTWRETRDGEITWANRAYLDIAEAVDPSVAIQPWPPAHLFKEVEIDPADSAAQRGSRVLLTLADDDRPHWFTLHRVEIGHEVQFTALPADEVVRAERTLSEFVTTLTKTFAHLPIGLAIFDRQRRLNLFNPALTELTLLPPEFLCSQPTLFDFLDRLRERRMMPEPKDYKSWKLRMADLEKDAVNGSYMETWHLPTGQTYRVTGRPHPDGAVAFLFEDVTAEVSLTRRFRAEIEMGQAALDSMPEAVAIFSPAGVLTMSNRAYATLWEIDPSASLGDITVNEATASWNEKCAPTPVWRQLRSFLREPGERRPWTAPVTLLDGRSLTCRFVPLAQGATMVAFAGPNPAVVAEPGGTIQRLAPAAQA